MKSIKKYILIVVISILLLLLILLFASMLSGLAAAIKAAGADDNGNLTAAWTQYRGTVSTIAAEYGVADYTEIFMAMIRYESAGNELDVMGSSLSEYNTDYPRICGGITDTLYSIRTGIREMKDLLRLTGTSGADDEGRLEFALMCYRLGRGYYDYAVLSGGHSDRAVADYKAITGVVCATDYGRTVIAYSKLSTGDGYIFPFETGHLSSAYGKRRDPVTGREGAFHSGIDIPKSTGTPIMVCNTGVVRSVGYDSVRGNFAEIDHADGVMTRYMHMSAVHVHVGQSVTKGDIIGEVGSTGKSTGAHLHLTFLVNGNTVDPLQYVTVPGD